MQAFARYSIALRLAFVLIIIILNKLEEVRAKFPAHFFCLQKQ